jgi:hypothetical protein
MNGYIHRYLTEKVSIRSLLVDHICLRFSKEQTKFIEKALLHIMKERDVSQQSAAMLIEDLVHLFAPSPKLQKKITRYFPSKTSTVSDVGAMNQAWDFYTQHFSVLFRHYNVQYGIRLYPQSTKYAGLCFDFLGEDDGFWTPAYGNNYTGTLHVQRAITGKGSAIYRWAEQHSIDIDSPRATMPDKLHCVCEHPDCTKIHTRSYVVTRWNATSVSNETIHEDEVDHIYCEDCFRRVFEPYQFAPDFRTHA